MVRIPETMPNRPFVIGLTGAFGSGCSTAARYLAELDNPYVVTKLSSFLRSEWHRRNPDESREPTRHELQDLGDEMRKEGGVHAVVAASIKEVLASDTSPQRIALDAIRNLGEVRWLQEHFGDRFALFALYADAAERYQRYRAIYRTEDEFLTDDERDRGETAEEFGQQVARCVDNADVFVLNDKHLDEYERDEILKLKLARFVAIAEGRATEYPSTGETLMNLAFGAAHGSKCLKRQVGAVIARENEPWSTGYNENPEGMAPCVVKFSGTCFRDRVRQDRYTELFEDGAHCPNCGKKFAALPLPPWRCGNCQKSLDSYFFPDRAMWWCTALHAEHRAILNAGDRDLSKCTLYTTTFPCTLCAEKIIHAGIKRVVYMEAYPDKNGKYMLESCGVVLELFEGVRSRNFKRAFSGVQATKEAQAVEKVRQKALARERERPVAGGAEPLAATEEPTPPPMSA
jgi:deoxycytidylate deaminase